MATGIKKFLTKRNIVIVAFIAIVIAALITVPQFTGERAAGTEEAAETTKIKLGIPDGSPIWDTFEAVAKRDHNLDIEFVNFSDWHLPNTSLQAGELDANAFQHTLFVSAFNASSGGDLRPIGNYGVTAASFFSSKIDSLDELQDNAVVLVPKDPSNQGRALKLLHAAGLVKLDDEDKLFPQISDITENPRNLELKELEGLQLPTSLPDGDLVFIYHHQALRAGIDLETALFSDEELVGTTAFLPYHGVFVVREESIDDPVLLKLPQIYHSDEVKAAVEKENKGQTQILDIDPQKFLEIQQKAEAEARGED